MSKDEMRPLSPGCPCLRPVHRRWQDGLDRGLAQILLPFQTFYSLLWESQELKTKFVFTHQLPFSSF